MINGTHLTMNYLIKHNTTQKKSLKEKKSLTAKKKDNIV